MDDEPTVLRSRTGADFLAMMPALLGYTSTDSLLLVPFTGKRTSGGALRVDLSPLLAADPGGVAMDLVSRVGRVERCDAVAIILYAEETFPVARLKWEPLWRALEDALAAAGLEMKDGFVVTPDGWGSFYDPSVPPAGRQFAEIARSPLVAAAASVRGGEPVRAHDADRVLSVPDSEFVAALREAVILRLDHGLDSDAFGRLHPRASFDPIELVEDPLSRSIPEEVKIPEFVKLVELCAIPATRDQALLQIAFGRNAGLAVARDNARLQDIQRRTGRTMDEIGARELRTKRRRSGDLDGALIGDTAWMPDPQRMRRAIALLRHLVPALELIDRAGPLCNLGWLHWAMGANSVAALRLAEAARADPSLRMAEALRQLVESDITPKWLYRRP